MKTVLTALLGVSLALVALGALTPQASAQDSDAPQGGALFQQHCAACHGGDGSGRPGGGVTAGPPIDDVDVSYVDVTLRTGRMPIAAPEAGVRTERLDAHEREAVVAWMQERFDLPGELPQVGVGDAGRGQVAFVRHCAACHGAGGVGGVAGGGTFVPPVHALDPVTIAEAARVGPFEMPAFPPELIDDRTVADIAAYLENADTAPRTLLGLRELNEVSTALLVLLLLAATLPVIRVIARDPLRGGTGEEGP